MKKIEQPIERKITNEALFRFRALIITLSIVYLSLLIYIVFFARRRRNIHEHYINLLPIKKTLHDFYLIGPPHGGRWNFYTNFFGNILLFIPLAIVLMHYFKITNIFRVVIFGYLISCCIETTQYVFQIGFADVDDVILNTLGMFIGAVTYKEIKKRMAFTEHL